MRVIFRFEANQKTGLGHAMRCLGLAQGLVDGGHECRALTLASPNSYLYAWTCELDMNSDQMELTTENTAMEPGSVEDSARTVAACREFGADWLVLDSYAFGPDYLRVVASAPCRRLCFDDAGLEEAETHILLNQNCQEGESIRRERGVMLHLAGTRYFQARREIREADMNRDASCKTSTRILVTLGGEDSANLGLHVCKALHPLLPQDVCLDLACTAGKEGLADARAFAATHSNVDVHYRPDLVPLMQGATVAVCGGGVTSMELACLGVPSVVLILVDNQMLGASALVAQGCAYLADTPEEAASLASVLVSDSGARRDLAKKAMSMVDGLGAKRVVDEMERINLEAAW